MKLEDKIKSFDLRTELENKKEGKNRDEKLVLVFKDLARLILQGYFLVKKNNCDSFVKVQPTCVEIYCHEEGEGDDKIKDYIVYHRNKDNGGDLKSLFPLGVLHNHVSGIDITFEHGKDAAQAVRLSALIREFSVDESHKNEEQLSELDKVKIIDKPTYLYDALYSQYSVFEGGFSIQWVDGSEETVFEISEEQRCNVAEYELKEKMDKNKSYESPEKKTMEEHPDAQPTANKKYVQDMRMWRFKRSSKK